MTPDVVQEMAERQEVTPETHSLASPNSSRRKRVAKVISPTTETFNQARMTMPQVNKALREYRFDNAFSRNYGVNKTDVLDSKIRTNPEGSVKLNT